MAWGWKAAGEGARPRNWSRSHNQDKKGKGEPWQAVPYQPLLPLHRTQGSELF